MAIFKNVCSLPLLLERRGEERAGHWSQNGLDQSQTHWEFGASLHSMGKVYFSQGVIGKVE